MDLPQTASVVIIGGGVVGCSIAYHLAARGQRDVVLLESDAIGAGTTSKAAGGIRGQFPTQIEIEFSQYSLRVFQSFKDEFGVDPGYKQIGYLFLISDEADLRGFEQRIALQREMGVDVRVITPQDAKEIVPALFVDDLIAVVWGPQDGFAGPYEITSGFAKRARELGVRIIEGIGVTGIRLEGGRVAAVETDRGSIATPLAIDAAGPAGARVARMAGVDMPITPSRRHIFFTEPFPQLPGPVPLTTDRGNGFYFRKELDRVLISAGDAVDMGEDLSAAMDWNIAEQAVAKAIHRVPILEQASIAGGWAGLRPLTPDDHAIIGWAPGVPGFFLAIGFGGHGFQHSPAAGAQVAEWLLDGRPSWDLSLFDPARFREGRAMHHDTGPDAE